MRIRLLATLLAVCLAGCTVGPDYQRPTVVSPDAWRMDYPKATDVANTKWWEQFGDPVLNELVETALRENLDIQIAAARVDQFIGALTSTRSQLFPQIGYGADASRIRASAVGQPPLPPGADPYFSLYQGSLGASWQLDLFGRVRRLTEAAQAQVYASEQAQHGVVLSLVTSIATSYILLRALDRQLQIAQYTANNFTATARLFELRFKSGIVAKTEVMQIRSQQQQALAAIPAFEQAIASQENLISILLGRNPGPIARGKTIDQLVAPQIPADLPSALLQRRPDILQAEQNLVAANANIGAARALYYPNISLTALLGTVSTVFSSLLTDPASSEVAFQEERVLALREFARLSTLRFDKGVSGYLEVLVAENELFAAELAAVRLLADRYIQLINVYQAMGGGWVDIAVSIAPGPQGKLAAQVP